MSSHPLTPVARIAIAIGAAGAAAFAWGSLVERTRWTLRRVDVPAGSAQGDPVRDGDQEVGEITSVVLTRALAWVKRSSGVGEVVLH